MKGTSEGALAKPLSLFAAGALASVQLAAASLRPHACGVEVGMTHAAVAEIYPGLRCAALANLALRCFAEVANQRADAACGGSLTSLTVEFDFDKRVSRARAVLAGKEMARMVREFARSLGDPEVRGIYEWHAAHLWETSTATLVVSGRREGGAAPQIEIELFPAGIRPWTR